ncbi:hypothetical protein BDN71DRAFT_1240540 [Pleurotus eryngii]|uniref:Uncharacterized protein n=1 Tax=Pleurotus eryngii TaxID=5323 RepID=A0A9P6D496_PLEER|nr:hypothetical protein BDN71DRAFT_1240540 [Pleurotus eryngii]
MVCVFLGRAIDRITRFVHTAVAAEAQRASSKEIAHEAAIRDLKHRTLTAASRGCPQKIMATIFLTMKPKWVVAGHTANHHVRLLYRNGAQVRPCSSIFD